MKWIIVSAALALGALVVASSPAAADAKKKQVRALETQRNASSPARLWNDASTKVSSSGHRVGLDGRLEYCAGF